MQIDKVAEGLERFVNSEDWEDARRIVDENRDLLSDEALALLNESIRDYREAGRDDVADYLEEHRDILARAREVGTGQAFQEANTRAQQALEARRSQLAELRPTSPSPLQAAVWQLLDATSPEEVDRVLSDHPELTQGQEPLTYLDELMNRAEKAGHVEAHRFLREYHELLRTYFELPPTMRALQELMAVPTWTEARDVLKNNPQLLSDQAVTTMDNLISEADAQGDETTADALETYRQVLIRAREVGPEQAVAELLQPQ